MNIKTLMEELVSKWTWEAVTQSDHRRKLIFGLEGEGIQFRTESGHEYTFRHDRKNGDLRIWTKNFGGLVQWRSDFKKGNRLVSRQFGAGANTERLDIEDIFMDPLDIEPGEISFFETLYPEFVPFIPDFIVALSMADKKLQELKKGNKQ